MDTKTIKSIIEKFLAEYSKQTDSKRVKILEKDIKERLANPSPHDQTELFTKAYTLEEKIAVKCVFSILDYIKPLL